MADEVADVFFLTLSNTNYRVSVSVPNGMEVDKVTSWPTRWPTRWPNRWLTWWLTRWPTKFSVIFFIFLGEIFGVTRLEHPKSVKDE